MKLTVFDVLGREVEVLVDGLTAPGTHEIRFDGRSLPGGVYLYQMQKGRLTSMGTMTLAK